MPRSKPEADTPTEAASTPISGIPGHEEHPDTVLDGGKDGRPRMEDVARVAGVALVTVSRAINTPGKLSAKTLAAIEKAIDQLGFVPNLMAGNLASKRSRIIAALVPTISNSLFADTVDGLAEVLAAQGYQLLLGQTRYHVAEETALISAFLGRRVDGIVLTGATQDNAARIRLKKAGIPIVETWDLPEKPIDMAIGFDNEKIGRDVASYLIGKGYHHLGFFGSIEERSMKRMKGFTDEVTRRGHCIVAQEVVNPPSSLADGARMLSKLVARAPNVRAIFCSNDTMAAGALFECTRQGWAVPERIAIIGFADLPISAASIPNLTTVHIGRKEMGIRAGKMLLSRLDGVVHPETTIDMGFTIMERQST